MVEALGILIAIACCLLTYATIGLLRRAADLRLYLTGHTTDAARGSMLLDAGFQLPPEVVESTFSDSEQAYPVLFTSNTCKMCETVLAEIDRANDLPTRITICPVDGSFTAPLETSLRSREDVQIMSSASADALVEHLRISETPVVIVVQDGYVLASSLGEDAASLGNLAELWESAAGLTTG